MQAQSAAAVAHRRLRECTPSALGLQSACIAADDRKTKAADGHQTNFS
jgi:hypothetical protein